MPSCLARAVTLDSMRSLMIEPGHTLLTRIPSRPTSSASVLANATTPMRVTSESTRLGMGWLTVLARMLMMRPARCRLRCGSASRHIRPKKKSARCTAVSHCSSVALWAWARGGPPELFTRTSRRPKRATVFATRSRTVSGRSRSPAKTSTSRPVVSWISFAALSRSGCERLHRATVTPSCARTSAHARPSPFDAPPTIATLSFSSRSIAVLSRQTRGLSNQPKGRGAQGADTQVLLGLRQSDVPRVAPRRPLRTPLHLVPLDQKLRRVRPAEREAVAIKGAELLELHRLRPGHFDLPVDLVAFH